jgi:predicted CopG family antitoxin
MNVDIRTTAICNEVYPMLVEMCQNSGITISDLIRELHAKQQLTDLRASIVVSGDKVGLNG